MKKDYQAISESISDILGTRQSLSESLIDEGVKALHELQTAGGAAASGSSGPVGRLPKGLGQKRAGPSQSLRRKIGDIARGQQPINTPGGPIPGPSRGQMIKGLLQRPRRSEMRKAGPLIGSPLTLRDF